MKLLAIILVWCLGYVQNLEEGDTCYLPTGQNGKCINIKNCQYARNLLHNRQDPGICGFQGFDPLVCCIDSVKIMEYGALSKAKCLEYYPRKPSLLVSKGAQLSLVREFPHMAILGYDDENSTQWMCGGSLISKNFILTAAHCLKRRVGSPTRVRLGDLDLSVDTDDAQPQDFSVKRVIPHPAYKRPSRYHDIGLIELDRSVRWTRYVRMACLDTRREHYESTMIVCGWGKVAFIGAYSSILLKSDFDIIPHSVCSPFYKRDLSSLPYGVVDDGQICAGGKKEKDTCQGDSGGPLQIKNPKRSKSTSIVYDIVGITSFGKACGLSNSPGIYTRVYNYLPWIESIVWKSL